MKPNARPDAPEPDRAGSPRRTLLVLAIATAIGSTGLAAGGTAGALLGAEMTGTEAAAGLPLGVLVLGSAVAAVLVSRRAGSVGRGRSLALGYVLGLSGAVVVVSAAVAGSFAALLLGSAALGAGNVAVFMARYAAAEIGGEAARGRALGAVFLAAAAGSVFAPSLLGPSGEAAATVGLPPLTGLYLVAVLCFAIAALLLAAASSPRIPFFGREPSLLGPGEWMAATRSEIASGLKAPAARTGLLALAAVNLVMVAVMAIAPVHMVAHGHDLGLVGIAVGAHVAGMFLPSPVSGWVADRAGPAYAVAAGLLCLVAAGLAGAVLDASGIPSMAAVLLMLGVGWNFGVVGGSALLAASVAAKLRPHAEGLGEVSMGLAAGAGAPIAGLVVALGGFATLSLAGAVVAAAAVLALALAGRPTSEPDARSTSGRAAASIAGGTRPLAAGTVHGGSLVVEVVLAGRRTVPKRAHGTDTLGGCLVAVGVRRVLESACPPQARRVSQGSPEWLERGRPGPFEPHVLFWTLCGARPFPPTWCPSSSKGIFPLLGSVSAGPALGAPRTAASWAGVSTEPGLSARTRWSAPSAPRSSSLAGR